MSDDVLVTDWETGVVLSSGKAALRPRYEERFKTPVHASLLGRLVCGKTVVDREIITGQAGIIIAKPGAETDGAMRSGKQNLCLWR